MGREAILKPAVWLSKSSLLSSQDLLPLQMGMRRIGFVQRPYMRRT